MRRPAVAIAVALAAALSGVGTAGADAITGAQLRSLAVRAPHDPAALARLSRVDSVDGRPVDLARALRGARGPQLAARLRILAQSATPASPIDSLAARREARAVLAASRFHEQRVPQPLHGVLAWTGRQLHPLGAPLRWLARVLGGTGRLLFFLSIAVALFAGGFALATARRRAAAETYYFPDAPEGDRGASPAELERRAAERERAGDYEAAVRLRFRAGLLTLDRARAIRYRPSLTSAELSHTLGSDDFDGVAHEFDEIVYGGRPALERDALAAREGWQRVIANARRRDAR